MPQKGKKMRSQRSRSRPEVQQLKQIKEMLANQQTSPLPNVKDVIIPRIRRDHVYTFEQVVNATVTSSTTVEVDNAYSFSLSQLTNASSFTTIFDTYRILGVVVRFFPTGGLVGPTIYTVIDYDDGNAITVATMQTYETLKAAPSGVYFERQLVPRIALAAYSGAFTSYAQANKLQWIDCASPTVNHYGLKIDTPISTVVYTWNVQIMYSIQFRNTR